jgi:hypothetical protein
MKISSLPRELFINIFEFLSIQDLSQTYHVSREWQNMSTDLQLWKKQKSYPQFVRDVQNNSKGMFQICCFVQKIGCVVAFCPFTRLAAVGQGQEDATQKLMDVLCLAQVIPERSFLDVNLYSVNEGKSRGKIQEGVYVQNENYISTYAIQHFDHCLSLYIHPSLEVSYVETKESKEKEIIMKTQSELLPGSRFVCWEKCSFGMVWCSDVFFVQQVKGKHAKIMSLCISGDGAIEWNAVKDTKRKRFDFWFGENSSRLLLEAM